MRITIRELKSLIRESLYQEKQYFVVCDSNTGSFVSQTEQGYPHLSDKIRDVLKFSDPQKAESYIKNSGRNHRNSSLRVCKMEIRITPLES